MYKGEAEYDSIKAAKKAISIPVIANGDISSPAKAKFVLDYTGADALMIGRPAQGRPWIFKEIQHFLEHGTTMAPIPIKEIKGVMLDHVNALHHFYGDFLGPRIARKHVGWYLSEHDQTRDFRRTFNAIEGAPEQLHALKDYFDLLQQG
jgi:tRNA-dihydrouridine synthase B